MARQEFRGDIGGVTDRGDVIICNGGAACPLHRGTVAQSAREEDEFYRLTGIRTGSSRVRELLEAFHRQHGLTWRGRGIERMWRHRIVEYDDVGDCLRLNGSWGGYAWAVACALAAITVVVLLLIVMALGTSSAIHDYAVGVASIAAYLGIFWVAIEHMVIPEALARRLKRRQRRGASVVEVAA